ncbi:endonuclease, partial [Mycobacterium sp. ITM-2017-0098]
RLTQRPARMIRILATLMGLTALAVAIVGLGVRYLPVTGHPTLILVVAAPYLAVAAPAAVLLLGLGRRYVLTLVAFAVTVAVVWVY